MDDKVINIHYVVFLITVISTSYNVLTVLIRTDPTDLKGEYNQYEIETRYGKIFCVQSTMQSNIMGDKFK